MVQNYYRSIVYYKFCIRIKFLFFSCNPNIYTYGTFYLAWCWFSYTNLVNSARFTSPNNCMWYNIYPRAKLYTLKSNAGAGYIFVVFFFLNITGTHTQKIRNVTGKLFAKKLYITFSHFIIIYNILRYR